MNKLIQKILSSAAILSTATIIAIHSQIPNSIYAYEIADAQRLCVRQAWNKQQYLAKPKVLPLSLRVEQQ